jgi:HAD superfamily hydrolase (TIGR01509 family)
MTRVLFFDIGNVLVSFDPHVAIRKLAVRTPYSPEAIAARLRGWGRIAEFECGRLSTPQFFEEFCSHLQMAGMTLESFTEAWSDIFPDQMLVRREVLQALQQNYRLILVSNTNPLHYGFLQDRFPFLDEFDDAVLSYKVGAMKPAREIFMAALEKGGCAPDEALLIDDLEVNVAAARSFGIPALRFCDEAQMLLELTGMGIEVSQPGEPARQAENEK